MRETPGVAKPVCSVVIATYNRGEALERLLVQLGAQTIAASTYEVIVVDDGSAVPVAPRLQALATPYALRVITQENAGPAVARHSGITASRGEILVMVDDDMQIAGDFLAAHLAMHQTGSRNVVLGRVTTDPSVRLPLFERYAMAKLHQLAERVGNGTAKLRGSDLYTANVSMRSADYAAAGGFDRSLRLSEDSELGMRLEVAGAAFVLSQAATAVHASDHVSLDKWLSRARAYGASDSRISAKHSELPAANPWRFLFMVNPVSRMFMAASVAMPRLMGGLAWLAMRTALLLSSLGAERAAIAGTTFVYGLQYFRGIRENAGSRRRAFDGLRRFLGQCRDDEVGAIAGLMKLVTDLRADHEAMLHADAKYRSALSRRPRLASDVVQRIGLQIMCAYRVMRYLRARRLTLLTKVTARVIRHAYGADIHWDAELAPGVMLVHGLGLVVGHAAKVGPGCVLFQNVTLGENIHPETREIGAPILEADVHVGPGATLLGPIIVGAGTKITAGALLMQSVPPRSLVESPAPTIRQRSTVAKLARVLPIIALFILPTQSCMKAEGATHAPGATVTADAAGASMTVDCALPAHPISPLIYGVAYDPRFDARDTYVWTLGATARRWGGNPASRYNWQLGNAWNTANDWFFRNVDYTGTAAFTYDDFLDANISHQVSTALTMPMLGYVAKDTVSWSFPRTGQEQQQGYDPERADAGNGMSIAGTELLAGDPSRTSVAAPPEMIGAWVSAIRSRDASRGRSVHMYMLDNEPSLWNSTHRDVHPEPTSYDELLSRTIAYGTAIRRADSAAVIAGPAEWGWPAYLFSAVDAEAGFRNKPDRRRHGDVPLIPWYLRQLREHERKTGVRVLDVVDVHFYPQADGVFGTNGRTDAVTSALRIRSTRSLWDSSYVDESWIQDTVRLIPRLREWIAGNYPGLGIAIGEWNFGAEQHISGGLAVAEALGQFGRGGITAAFYWTYPPDGSPAFHAFRAFRNYDGAGRTFGDWSLAASAGSTTSLFASLDDARRTIVLVALNRDADRPASARIDHASCGTATARRQFVYRQGSDALTPMPGVAPDGSGFNATLPPYSITVFEITLDRPVHDATAAR